MKRFLATIVASATVVRVGALDPDGSCRLLSVLPFTDEYIFTSRGANRTAFAPYTSPFSRWYEDTIAMTGYTYMAAALLAIEHFNRRDASVIPEIASLPTECTAFFSNESTIVNGGFNNVVSGKRVFEASKKTEPCALVGPSGMYPSMWTAAMTASIDVPQVFYAPAPSLVTEPDLYRNTIRVSVHTEEYVNKILSFVKHMNRKHLAVLHGGTDYDRVMAMYLEQQSVEYGVNVTAFPLYPPSKKVDPKAHSIIMYNMLKQSGIRTIFRAFIDGGPNSLERLAGAAESHGMLSDDYLYILEEHVAPVDDLPRIMGAQPANSALDKLLSGAVAISSTEVWESGSDSLFLQSWRSQNKTLVDLANANVPLTPDEPEYFQASYDFFQTHLPRRGAAMVYDSVMAVGFGACHAQTLMNSTHNDTASGNETKRPTAVPAPAIGGIRHLNAMRGIRRDNEAPPSGGDPSKGPPPGDAASTGGAPKDGPPGGPPPLSVHEIKNPHVKGIAQTTFTGASGRLAFGDGIRDRVAGDVSYGAYNIRPVAQPDGTHRYEVVLVTQTVGEEWHSVTGRSFVFRDGTSVLQGNSLVMSDEHFLPTWIRVFGFTLMTIAWCVTLGLLFAVWYWREKPLVKAGQPVFLYVVCFGSFLTSSAIYTLSFDEASDWNNRQLDVACTMTPWLFFLGINSTFAGLFCKLWRIDQVTQFRRRQVKVIQAAWPLILLLASSAVCLLVWTVVDPWTWKREIIVESPPESYGKCESKHFAGYFSTLSCIMIVATALAFGMAWKTKNLKMDSRFSDTNTVFLAIASQLQAWFVGLPILAVLDDSSVEATYLGRVLLIWLFSMASVLIVIAPKIYQTWRKPNESARTSRVFVSGLQTDLQSSASGLLPKPSANPLANSFVHAPSGHEKAMDKSSTAASSQEQKSKSPGESAVESLSKTSERLDV